MLAGFFLWKCVVKRKHGTSRLKYDNIKMDHKNKLGWHGLD
jgi:hypothetical protein